MMYRRGSKKVMIGMSHSLKSTTTDHCSCTQSRDYNTPDDMYSHTSCTHRIRVVPTWHITKDDLREQNKHSRVVMPKS